MTPFCSRLHVLYSTTVSKFQRDNVSHTFHIDPWMIQGLIQSQWLCMIAILDEWSCFIRDLAKRFVDLKISSNDGLWAMGLHSAARFMSLNSLIDLTMRLRHSHSRVDAKPVTCVPVTKKKCTSPPNPWRALPVTTPGAVNFLNLPHRVGTIYVMTLRERHPRRWLSRRLRFMGLTSHEQVELRKLKKYIILFACLHNKAIERGDHDEAEIMQECQSLCEIRFFNIKFVDKAFFSILTLPSLERTIESFDDSSCDQQFRFLKHHLHLLLRLFDFLAWLHYRQRP